MSTIVNDTRAADPVAAPASGDRGPGLLRLTLVELRKSVNTRAGLWLLVAIVAVGAVALGLLLGFAGSTDRTLETMLFLAQTPAAFMLPVLGILLITSEWSQRTALTTFTLVPQRSRVLAAKVLAMVVLAVAVTVATTAVAFLAFGVGDLLDRTSGGWQLTASALARSLLSQEIGILLGAMFGLVLLNTPAAIVASFAVPIAWTALTQAIPALRDPSAWLDPVRTTDPLIGPEELTTVQWERLGVSLCVWLLLPAVFGVWRLHRKEIS
jgi:ABC-2 type transport system permease protein